MGRDCGICQDRTRFYFRDWNDARTILRASERKAGTCTDRHHTRPPATTHTIKENDGQALDPRLISPLFLLSDSTSRSARAQVYRILTASFHTRNPDQTSPKFTSPDNRHRFEGDIKSRREERDGAQFFREANKGSEQLECIVRRNLPSTKRFTKPNRIRTEETASGSDKPRSRSAADDRRCIRRHPVRRRLKPERQCDTPFPFHIHPV